MFNFDTVFKVKCIQHGSNIYFHEIFSLLILNNFFMKIYLNDGFLLYWHAHCNISTVTNVVSMHEISNT